MKHIILIGFKHVGKSSIAKELASCLDLPLTDVDLEIEKDFQGLTGDKLTCREIVQARGQNFFRKLEKEAVKKSLLQQKKHVISLGGGALADSDSQKLIKSHQIIHITAPKGIVFERIMVHGKPAFFPKDAEPFVAFNHLWNERESVFKKFSSITVTNDKSVSEAVNKIVLSLNAT
jgi:shikimate kinase